MAPRILQIVPFPLGEHDLAQRQNHVPDRVRASGAIVDTVGARNSFATDAPRVGTTYYEWALLEAYAIEAGLAAEESGYDAVVIDTTTDSGLKALRSRLAIPVVGAGMTGYAVALTLGNTFSVVTFTDDHRFLVEDSLKSYGLEDRCASIRSIGMPPVLEGAPKQAEDEEIARFTEAGRLAVETDGAHSVLMASTTMHKIAAALGDELTVPVIDPGPVAVAAAEFLVSFGLTHSKAAYPSPGRIQDASFHRFPGKETGGGKG